MVSSPQLVLLAELEKIRTRERVGKSLMNHQHVGQDYAIQTRPDRADVKGLIEIRNLEEAYWSRDLTNAAR